MSDQMVSDERKQRLLEVLSTGDERAMANLCREWGIETPIVYPSDGGRPYYNTLEMVMKLAQSALTPPPAPSRPSGGERE